MKLSELGETRLSDAPEFDADTGAPFGIRAKASFKLTPEGKRALLEESYGKENVHILSNGTAFFLNPDNGVWTAFDEEGLSFNDFTADIAGPATEAAPAIAASFLTASPIPVALSAGGGSLLRQGISENLPGDDELSNSERLAAIGTNAVLAGAFQLGSNALFSTIDRVRPSNLITKSVQESMESPFAKKGARLQDETGLTFSPGQQSGSRGQLLVEGLARRHPITADKVFQFDQSNLKAATKRLGVILDKLDSRQFGPIPTGVTVRDTFDKAVTEAIKARRKQAVVDYARVGAAAKGRPVVETKNLSTEIQSIIDEFDVPGAETIVNQAKRFLKQFGDEPLTIERATKARSIYSKASRGTGQIFKDVETSQARMLAGRLKNALEKDIQSAGEKLGDDAGVLLKTANENYRVNSAAIRELENSVLGRLFRGRFERAPEDIADAFLKMRPSEIQGASHILNQQDPLVMQAVKRHVLQTVIDKAVPSASQTVAGGVKFSGAKFNSALPDDSVMLSLFSRKEFVDIKRVSKALERVVDRAGTDGSPTAPLLLAWDAVRGVFTMSPVATGRAALSVLAPRHIARAMTTPEGRRALLTLTSSGKAPKAIAFSAGYLGSLIAADPDTAQSVGPGPDQLRAL